MIDIAAFIAGLPKVELHVHHIGSASPRIVAELAARHEGSSPVPADPELLAAYFTFTDFAKFVEVYLTVVDLVRDPEDIRMVTYEIGRELAGQNVRYVELTLTPASSISRGIAAEAFCEAVEDARSAVARDFGVDMAWCFDIPGEAGIPAAELTLDAALRCRPDGLVSFGLGGPEVGVPRPQFKPSFDQARSAGLHSVPHAGESTGPTSVWDAVEHLGAERIGHGIAAAQDSALLERLASGGIVLEVCPASNVCTRSVPSLEEHPLPALVDAGITVTINSDDPPMFGTTINQEYEVAARLLGLDPTGVAALALAAVDASFAGGERKAAVRREVAAYAAAAPVA